MKLTLIFLVLAPVILTGADITILRDSPSTGNDPGMVVAVFAGVPETVLDTIGYRFEGGQPVPVTREMLSGNHISDPDSMGMRDTTFTRVWVNWSKADTVTVQDTLPAKRVTMNIRYVAGQWHDSSITPEMTESDSLWRAGRR